LLVGELTQAVRTSKAQRIFVCNVATEPGETTGFAVGDFVRVLQQHVGDLGIDCVLANGNLQIASPLTDEGDAGVELVRLDGRDEYASGPSVICADLISAADPRRHDPYKLAATLGKVALGSGARNGALARPIAEVFGRGPEADEPAIQSVA